MARRNEEDFIYCCKRRCIVIPKVFAQMGSIGNLLGALFFLMVLFAALTSSMSVLEAIVSGLMDRFHWSRRKASVIEGVIAMGIGIVV